MSPQRRGRLASHNDLPPFSQFPSGSCAPSLANLACPRFLIHLVDHGTVLSQLLSGGRSGKHVITRALASFVALLPALAVCCQTKNLCLSNDDLEEQPEAELLRLARSYVDQGNAEAAESCYRRAIDAGSVLATIGLGDLLRQRQDQAGAESSFLRAADAGSTTALLRIGNLYYFAGDLDVAERCYLRAAEAGDPEGSFDVALVREMNDDPAGAMQWYWRSAELNNGNAMHSLAYLLQGEGRLDEAESWCRRAAEGGNSSSMHNLGTMLFERGDLDEAESWFRTAIALENEHAVRGLGALLRTVERRDEVEVVPGQEIWTLSARDSD